MERNRKGDRRQRSQGQRVNGASKAAGNIQGGNTASAQQVGPHERVQREQGTMHGQQKGVRTWAREVVKEAEEMRIHYVCHEAGDEADNNAEVMEAEAE